MLKQKYESFCFVIEMIVEQGVPETPRVREAFKYYIPTLLKNYGCIIFFPSFSLRRLKFILTTRNQKTISHPIGGILLLRGKTPPIKENGTQSMTLNHIWR